MSQLAPLLMSMSGCRSGMSSFQDDLRLAARAGGSQDDDRRRCMPQSLERHQEQSKTLEHAACITVGDHSQQRSARAVQVRA